MDDTEDNPLGNDSKLPHSSQHSILKPKQVNKEVHAGCRIRFYDGLCEAAAAAAAAAVVPEQGLPFGNPRSDLGDCNQLPHIPHTDH